MGKGRLEALTYRITATSATTLINRYDFGIDYGRAKASMVDRGVGREIAITVHAEFFKMAPLANSDTPKKIEVSGAFRRALGALSGRLSRFAQEISQRIERSRIYIEK